MRTANSPTRSMNRRVPSPPLLSNMMLQLVALICFILGSASSFSVDYVARRKSSPALFMTASTNQEVPIIINGNNIELTPSLVEYVHKRLGRPLTKLASHGAVRECDVILSVNKNPKVKNNHRVEVVTNLKGTTIICKNDSDDMYSSIDAAAGALNRKLRKYKERRVAGWHGGNHMSDDLAAALDELDQIEDLPVYDDQDDEFDDPGRPTVTKVNSFDLDKPISVDEAVFALDYVDHDFYVFRNEATDKITVVYKRHGGGVGLVEP